ncbi:MAG: TatD family hydrolase [Lentisphaeria bacterium]|nr:TatD family hydrolase [Lentisphaeria bacterium]
MRLTDAHTHRIPGPEDRPALVNLKPGERPGPAEEGIYYSCGIHPADEDRFTLEDLRRTVDLVSVAAIGECGLDALAGPAPERQEAVFRAQAALAEELRLPMVIHCVRKPYELIGIRKALRAQMPWLVHGFRGGREVAEAWLKTGCLLSLSVPWLMHLSVFPDWLPRGSFLLETDESETPLASVYTHAARLLDRSTDQLAEELQAVFVRFLGKTV